MIKLLKRFAEKIEKLNEVRELTIEEWARKYHTPTGMYDGDICYRKGCMGSIIKVDGQCTCHTGNPPCGYCTDAPYYCNECGWEEGQDD